MNNKTFFKTELHFRARNHVGIFSLATKPNNYQRDTQPHYKSLASRITPETPSAFHHIPHSDLYNPFQNLYSIETRVTKVCLKRNQVLKNGAFLSNKTLQC
jgi:hypothetical protein